MSASVGISLGLLEHFFRPRGFGEHWGLPTAPHSPEIRMRNTGALDHPGLLSAPFPVVPCGSAQMGGSPEVLLGKRSWATHWLKLFSSLQPTMALTCSPVATPKASHMTQVPVLGH